MTQRVMTKGLDRGPQEARVISSPDLVAFKGIQFSLREG